VREYRKGVQNCIEEEYYTTGNIKTSCTYFNG